VPEQSEWQPEAGWYPNPENRRQQLYWDGAAWTDQSRELNVFDRITGAGRVAGPGAPQFQITQVAAGLAILGAALIALAWALPATKAPGLLAGTPVEDNKLGEQLPWFWPAIAALAAGWSAFRAHRDSIRVWAPVVIGAGAILLAIGLGTSEEFLTLYPPDSFGLRGQAQGAGVVGDPGAAIYVLGAGGLGALLGGLMIRAAKPLEGAAPVDQVVPGDIPGGANAGGSKLCPECAEEVKAADRRCKHCGHQFAQVD
jgi:hypothetical protein